jgi:hypothetical protein
LTVIGNVFYKAGKWDVLLGGGSDNMYKNNIFIGNKIGFHVDDRLQNWARKEMLGEAGLFKKRLAAVHYQRPPYSVEYPRLSGYFKNPGTPAENLVEDNVFVQVGKLLDGEMEWLDYKKSNWIANQDIGFKARENEVFSLNPQSVVYRKVPGFKEIHFSRIGLYKSTEN